MSYKIDVDDQKWIDAAKDDPTKDARKAAILNLMEMNGLKYEPGIGKSYIPEKNYYVYVVPDGLAPHVHEVYEKALNFVALGSGIGGLAGAGVRWGLRDKFDKGREMRVVDKLDDEAEDALQKFTDFSHSRKETVPFWTAQADNVLGLAGAIFNREMHHWNAENTKPQKALLGALGQEDDIPEGEYRKLFYLAIHPVPLDVMENLRQLIVEGKVKGISDAVGARCRSAPAGYGDIHACAQGASDIRSEVFYSKFGNSLKDAIDNLIVANIEIVSEAGNFHAFAASYKKQKKVMDKVLHKRAMICCAAYIIVHVKGSLAQSAALKKYKASNNRMIQKWITAFENESNDVASTIVDLGKD